MNFSRAPSRTYWKKEEEVQITGLSHDGRGLARYQGKTIFVEGALEQETVTIQPIKAHRKFMDARVRQVLAESTERCQVDCPHFGQCGGCSLQYWSHEGQLKGKQRIVLDQLNRFGGIAPVDITEPLVSEPYGYRHRCRLAIRWQKGQLQLGFRASQSQSICDINVCPVLAEPLQALPELLRNTLPTLKGKRSISHAELFLADNGRAILLRHIKPLSDHDRNILSVCAERHQLHLFLQDNDRQIHCLYAADGDDKLYYSLPESGLKMAFQPSDFTQVNGQINRKMVAQAIEWLDIDEKDQILDLYCGLGNFSLAMAKKAGTVVGVEGGAGAVARARENAGINQLTHCEFFVVDLSGEITHQEWANRQYDAVVLDPPRVGAQEVIEQLGSQLPGKVLYISCNPATLARDAGLLKAAGFQLQRFGVMDMFPQTAHIESMALFVR
ncbi:23S rRNA (uracil(1939)-C(5))-methyltransferase RlmD [Endozoicomonas sp. Mp262]|uniref:23S rRNA (uracil(1939)-C(5))-methyltransferase RlmD n=1 Tax=Endozoicomonas sp. Mp262 TaxID=2919499 RepID=UPI0021D8ABBB